MLSEIIRRLLDIPRRATLRMPAPLTARLGRDVFEFEDRLVPATATFNAGVLVITAQLASDNDTVSIVAAGANSDGSTGVTATYWTSTGTVTQTFGDAAHPVTNIALDLQGGNDTVNVASLTATAVLVGEADGNNNVTIGATRFGGVIAGMGQNTLSVGGGSQNVWSTTALPGFTAGTGVCVGWRYTFVNGGQGIATTGNPVGNANANVINMNTGAGQRSLVNLIGNGNNTVNGGDGSDGVYIAGNGNNALSMGAGDDLVIIDGPGKNTVSTGAGADSVTINGNGNNTVYTNGGNDQIAFHGTGTNLIDPPPPAVSVNSVQQVEGNGTTTLTFTVTLSAPNAFPLTVDYATQDGTALAGSDYLATSGTLTFAPGETTKTVTVTVLGDNTVEDDETFSLVLSNANSVSGATIGTGTGTATILNDDTTAVSASSVQQAEGDGLGAVTFTVTLSNPSAFPVSVDYATADGTALAGSDYLATNGTLTFAPGETTKTVTVTVLGDTTVEADETFTLALSSADAGTAVGTATLLNDDVTVVSVSSVQQAEGNSTNSLTFTVSLSNPSDSQVTVNFATQDGSAAAGSDYVSTSGTLNFAPGVTSQTVTVTVLGDNTVEADESFSLVLSNANGATIETGTGTATLLNDDATALSVSSVSQAEGNGTNTLTFTVTLSNPSAFPVTLNYTTADGTALAGSDYVATSGTLTFAPGETTKTVTVTILGDTTVESDETFTLVLSGASGATIAAATGTATLLNDDVFLPPPPPPPPPPPVDQHDNGCHNGFCNGPHYGYPDNQVSTPAVKQVGKNEKGGH